MVLILAVGMRLGQARSCSKMRQVGLYARARARQVLIFWDRAEDQGSEVYLEVKVQVHSAQRCVAVVRVWWRLFVGGGRRILARTAASNCSTTGAKYQQHNRATGACLLALEFLIVPTL